MEKVKQFGTMQMLIEGLLDGFTTIEEVLAEGNFGIGTGEGIDGELIVWDGDAYKVDSTGTVMILNKKFPIVYVNVHQGDFQFVKKVENISLADLRQEILNIVKTENIFFSVIIDGEFKRVKTRSVSKSKRPYSGLEKIAKNQANFSRENVQGHMIGYFTPVLYQGIGVPNFHQHFISNDFDFGGHVTDAIISSADVSIQLLSGIDIKLPIDSEDYQNADLNNTDRLNNIIKKSE